MKKFLAAAIAAVSIGGAASALEFEYIDGDYESGRVLITEIPKYSATAVSYTHLTLPTKA